MMAELSAAKEAHRTKGPFPAKADDPYEDGWLAQCGKSYRRWLQGEEEYNEFLNKFDGYDISLLVEHGKPFDQEMAELAHYRRTDESTRLIAQSLILLVKSPMKFSRPHKPLDLNDYC